ncbi:MAG: hypothetical protein AABZ39_15360 [Spirochaetota bacterium]
MRRLKRSDYGKSTRTSRRSAAACTVLAHAFLDGTAHELPFDEASLEFPAEDDTRSKQRSSRPVYFGIRQSRRFLARVRELEIVLAGLLDNEDRRILDMSDWLRAEGNTLFDIGMPRSGYKTVSPAARARAVYTNAYSDRSPYIADDGTSIPIGYLSHYLSGLGRDISFLLPQHGLNDIRSSWDHHMKGDIPIHTVALEPKRIDAGYGFFLRAMNGNTAAAVNGASNVRLGDIMQPVGDILSKLNELYDHFVHLHAKRTDIRFPKNIAGLLGTIRAWKWNGSPRPITASPEYEAFARTVQFPKVFAERWLPVYFSLRWLEHFLNDYRKMRRRGLRNAERMGMMYTKMGGALAQAIADVNRKREKTNELYLKKYELLLNPLALFAVLAPGKAASAFITGLSEIIAVLGKTDIAAAVTCLSNGKDPPAIDDDTRARVQRFAENLRAIPGILRTADGLEKEMSAWLSGEKRMTRPVTMRELLTAVLVPRTGWAHDIIGKLSVLPDNASLRTAIDAVIGEAIFSPDAPAAVSTDISALRTTFLDAVGNIVSVGEYLTGIAAASPVALRDHLTRKIFIAPHEIRIADMIIKAYRHHPNPIARAVELLETLTTDWPKPLHDGAVDHFHRCIGDGRFDALQKSLEDFGRNELFLELRREWGRISEEHDAETARIASELMEKGKLTTVAEQQRFLDERHAIRQKKRDDAYSAIMEREEQSDSSTSVGMPTTYNGIQTMLRAYLRPDLYWSKELFELLMMREYTAEDIPRIEELTFAMYTHYVNRIRFCHRFSEKDLPDPDAAKHIWPINPCAVIAPKNDLPSLDHLFREPRSERPELDPIHTPASIRAIIGACEAIFPGLFRLKRGTKLQYHDTLRKYDQSPLAVIITPPGVRTMREIPFRPRYFAGMRGRAFGSISRSAFRAREWNADIDYLYTGAVYDPRHNTIIISTDADETNLFHYILAGDKFTGAKIFSSVIMSLGMMIYHRLPEYFRSGDFGDNRSSWKSCLLQSRAAERIYFTKNSDDGRRFVSAQTSHLTYNVSLNEMSFDYYIMELEFASYFSEIMLELLSGVTRNLERPSVVDAWFSRQLALHSLRTMNERRHSDEKTKADYQLQHAKARNVLMTYLVSYTHSPIPRREIRGTPFPLSQGSERGKGVGGYNQNSAINKIVVEGRSDHE